MSSPVKGNYSYVLAYIAKLCGGGGGGGRGVDVGAARAVLQAKKLISNVKL